MNTKQRLVNLFEERAGLMHTARMVQPVPGRPRKCGDDSFFTIAFEFIISIQKIHKGRIEQSQILLADQNHNGGRWLS